MHTHLHGTRLADGARQTLRAAKAWDGADFDFGLTELCLVAREHNVASHRQLTAAACNDNKHSK